jgi:hypothetical protein
MGRLMRSECCHPAWVAGRLLPNQTRTPTARGALPAGHRVRSVREYPLVGPPGPGRMTSAGTPGGGTFTKQAYGQKSLLWLSPSPSRW